VKFRLLVVSIAVVVQLAWWTAPACAGILSDVQDTLADLTERVLSIRESLPGLRKRENEALKVLAERESQLDAVRADLRSLADTFSALESEVASLELALAQSESEARALAASVEQVTDSLRLQLRYLQKHGRVDDFLSFLVSESLAESQLTVKSLDQLLRLTDSVVSDYHSQLAELGRQRSELLGLMRDLDSKRSELNRTRQNREAALNELVRKTEETRTALTNARSQISDYERTLRELEESSAELQAIIEAQEREAAELERKAREGWIRSFLWPVSNDATAGHSIVGRSDGGYSGIEIETQGGAQVVAARSGQVVHSGWINGYGSTVVINHGSGYSTVYAHCYHLKVAAGDFVVAGEVIAEMGPMAVDSPPRLHFEVRKDGLQLDPMEYLESVATGARR
jgi:septal ring factor EnvC (AmiA/AmiB activator)